MNRPHRSGLLACMLLLAALAGCSTGPRAAATQPAVLLLGEHHDNAEGHRLRLADLQRRIDGGWRPAIAMEQFDHQDQPRLERAQRECSDAACVVHMAAPAGARWDWPHYLPVIELALRHRLPLLAANLSRADAGKVVRGGFAAALPQALVDAEQLHALPADLLAGQVEVVRIGHCDQLPQAMLEPMARAQVARDVIMAGVLRAHAADGVVLLAGNGHVRRDIGVPHWLRRHDIASHAVGYIERPAQTYDASVAIPPLQRPGACAGL